MPRLRRSDLSAPGFGRVRSGRGFRYTDPVGAAVKDADTLERIRALVIPPAWTDVWIAPWPNGHIQAVGTDAAGRRQYLYHPAWREKQDRIKFDRALRLAAALPAARRAVTRALASEQLDRERALAAAFRILDTASLRIGGEQYLNDHGSHGLSTLECRHVTVSQATVRFRFPAKSGQEWDCEVEDAVLASTIAAMRRRSGRLLGWRDASGWHPLSASDINEYVRALVGEDVTAKDFRTLRGSIIAALSLRDAIATTKTARERAIARAMREVAETLGNTPAVARNSYVDPRVLDRFRVGEVIATGRRPETALIELLS